MSHTTNILMKVLLTRMKSGIHQKINDCQYGLMSDKGMRNAVLIPKNLAEGCIEVNKKLYCCFIDFIKAFDRVQHNIISELPCDLDVVIDVATLLWRIGQHEVAKFVMT